MSTAAFELTPNKIASIAQSSSPSGAFELTPDKIATSDLLDPRELVRRYAPQYGIDPDLAERLADRESIHFRPSVVSGKQLSPRNAIGTMQLLQGTADSEGVDPYDLHGNIRGGLSYLKKQLDEFGDTRLALAAYNSGPQVVRDYRDGTNHSGKNNGHIITGGIPPFKETRDYVNAIAPQQGIELMPDQIAGLDQSSVDPKFGGTITMQSQNQGQPSGSMELTPDQIASVEPATTAQPNSSWLARRGITPPIGPQQKSSILPKIKRLYPIGQQTQSDTLVSQAGNISDYLAQHPDLGNLQVQNAQAGNFGRLSQINDAISAFSEKQQRLNQLEQKQQQSSGINADIKFGGEPAPRLTDDETNELASLRKQKADLIANQQKELEKQRPVDLASVKNAANGEPRTAAILAFAEKHGPLTDDERKQLGLPTDYLSKLGINTVVGAFQTGVNTLSGFERLVGSPANARSLQQLSQVASALENATGDQGMSGMVAHSVGSLVPQLAVSTIIPGGEVGEGLYWGGLGSLERFGQGGTAGESLQAGAMNLLPMLGARMVGEFIPGNALSAMGGRAIGNGALNYTLSAAQGGDRKANITAGLLGLFMGIGGADESAIRESIIDPKIEEAVNQHLKNPTSDTIDTIKSELKQNGLTEDQSQKFVDNLNSAASGKTATPSTEGQAPQVERAQQPITEGETQNAGEIPQNQGIANQVGQVGEESGTGSRSDVQQVSQAGTSASDTQKQVDKTYVPETSPRFYDNKSILQAVRANGGIRNEGMYTGELKQFTNNEAKTSGLVGPNSRWTIDQMTSVLNSDGFRDENGEELTPNSLLQLMDKEQRGQPVYSMMRSQELFDRELEKAYEQHLQDTSSQTDQFAHEVGFANSELEQPDSPLGRAFDSIIESSFSPESIDNLRRIATDHYLFSRETTEELINRATNLPPDQLEEAGFPTGNNEVGTDPIAEFLRQTETAGQQFNTDVERNQRLIERDIAQSAIQGGMGRGAIEARQGQVDVSAPLFGDEGSRQPTLEGLGGSEAGAVVPGALNIAGAGVPALIEHTIAPAGLGLAKAVKSAYVDIQKLFSPAGRTYLAKTASLIQRGSAAEAARNFDIAQATLRAASKAIMRLPEADRWDVIDKIENGGKQSTPEIQAIADITRKVLDDNRSAVQATGTGALQNYNENYFPHIWKDPAKAASVFAEYFGKRPFEGSKAFLKQRTIDSIALGRSLGLEPVDPNPLNMVLLKIKEMQRYVAAHNTFEGLKNEGLLKYVPVGGDVPMGYKSIDDNIFKVFGPRQGAVTLPPGAEVFDPAIGANRPMTPEDVTVIGRRTMGQYYAPESVANVMNNYLSPGLRGKPWFDAYMNGANILSRAQLGLSAYHAGFTVINAGVSKLSLGIEQLAAGHPLQAAKSTLSAATLLGPTLENMWVGNKMMREWNAPGSVGGEITKYTDAMVKAGGRTGMDDFYRTNITKNMINAFRNGDWWGGVLRSPFALIEQSSRPLMEWMIPRMKMGAFADLAKTEIEKLGPNVTHQQVREAVSNAWDSIDNRFGQMVYDNLFWNKTAKDLSMATVRAVGWNAGTFREIGGGAVDLAKNVRDVAIGKPTVTHIDPTTGKEIVLQRQRQFNMTSRMAYTLALPAFVGALGAMTMYMYTGQMPQETKDYFFPKTGKKDEQGNDERISFPSYMKDIYAYKEQPIKTLEHKANPMIGNIADMLNNADYRNVQIYNPDDPLLQRGLDSLKFFGRNTLPFSIQNMVNDYDRHGKVNLGPIIGITQAPSYINQSPADKMMNEMLSGRQAAAPMTKEQLAQRQQKRELMTQARAGNIQKIEQQKAQGTLAPRTATTMEKQALSSQTAIQARFAQLTPEQMQRIWNIMDQREKAEVLPTITQKITSISTAAQRKELAYKDYLRQTAILTQMRDSLTKR